MEGGKRLFRINCEEINKKAAVVGIPILAPSDGGNKSPSANSKIATIGQINSLNPMSSDFFSISMK
jgi:hypothetical protein